MPKHMHRPENVWRITGAVTNPMGTALAQILSVPRAEMQKRIEQAPKESVSRHKRYKYVPGERPAKP
jgi:hypothetical protein